jgi:hypothetical protein
VRFQQVLEGLDHERVVVREEYARPHHRYLRSVSRLTASEHGKLIVTFTPVSQSLVILPPRENCQHY